MRSENDPFPLLGPAGSRQASMKRASDFTMRLRLLSIALIPLLAASCVLFYRHGLYDVMDRERVLVPELLAHLADTVLIFVGETHNNPLHHQAQLEVVRQFHEKDRPVAIALEMFEAGDQDILDGWVAGTVDLHDFVEAYYRNWDMPWSLYGDLLVYAREHEIPLVAMNVSREIVSQVARSGFASLTPAQVEALPGVSCNVDENYRVFIEKSHGFHGQDPDSFERFCEAQMVWDTTMAHRLVEYVEKHPERQVVVIAGSGHAWKPGIPRQVGQRASSITSRVILPEEQARIHRWNVSVEDCDYLWLGLH